MKIKNRDKELVKKITNKLSEIIDPELNIDIVRLGLIRDIEMGEFDERFAMYNYIKIIMTLTTPMCPFADIIISDVEDKINELQIGDCEVELIFDPP